ncbi:hypothetical protein SAMN02745133_01510 [Desulforamulus putei DSM 12395]|uniref:Homeodomain-like domain-containing protein n=1 Tax=Desulforamulus putei DSM 12395 TaxID=1121429 RepID=A0A1M4XSS7_9FIRM|nr:hypothetical protein SAMN02745133_01510 [Desulforamulus putei DSM 12395]
MRWKMYSEIHQLKNMGLNKAQVARRLKINVKTVRARGNPWQKTSARDFQKVPGTLLN